MQTFNIHEAKTQLSKLIEMAVNGEPFIIAKAGKPLVKVERITEKPPQRIGFLEGQFEVPDDIDTMFADEIADMFEGKYDGSEQFRSKK
jgi:antitoxin (DNA-binding transcriptional repressor) of toxin-antitoxin stability system